MDGYANPGDHQGAETMTAGALSSIPFSGGVRVLDAPAAEDGRGRPPDEPGQGNSDGLVHRQRDVVRPVQELQVPPEVGQLAFTNPKEFERLATDALRKPGLSGLSDPAFKER